MKVRAIKRERAECPEEVRHSIQADGADVTIGTEYEVHCISIFNGLVELQIVDDGRLPAWYPLVLFEVTDGTIPSDWQCTCSTNNKAHGGVSMAIGPEFVVKDEASIQAMIELDADQVDRFWKRVEGLSSESASST